MMPGKSTTIAEVLREGAGRLAGIESARLDAELLLSHVLERPRSHLYAHPEAPVQGEYRARFLRLLERRRGGYSLARILGWREFFGLRLEVDEHTLVPRPETERLVELALERIPQGASWRIADLGTGSGAIALAVARHRPRCTLLAMDRSLPTLRRARANAATLALDNVHCLAGDWGEALRPGSLDLLLSNPPYVAEQDPALAADGLRREPRRALTAGPEGLDALRRIIGQAPRLLRPGGWLLLEHGSTQGDAVRSLLREQGLGEVSTWNDLAGHERVSGGKRP